METIINYIVIGIGIVLAFIFGRRVGNDKRRTLDRIDDSLTSAGSGVGHVVEGIDDSIESIEAIDREITELSHAISEDEQRLTEGVERLVELQLDARTGSERHKRIEDIIKELQKRNSNN